jgi:hypothetical protein
MHHAPSASSKQNDPAVQTAPSVMKRSRVVLQKADVMRVTNMPQSEAADRLGVSITTLQKACRKLDIARWPYQRRRQQQTDRLCASPPQAGSLRRDYPSLFSSDRTERAIPPAKASGGLEWPPSSSWCRPYPASADHAAQIAGSPVRGRSATSIAKKSWGPRTVLETQESIAINIQELSQDQMAYNWSGGSSALSHGACFGKTPAHGCPTNDLGSETSKPAGCGEEVLDSMYGGGCSTSTGGGGRGSSEDGGGTGGGTGASEDASEDGNGSDDCNIYSRNARSEQSCAGGSQSPGTGSQSESGSGSGSVGSSGPNGLALPQELDFDTVLRRLGRGSSKLSVAANARNATACLDQWL